MTDTAEHKAGHIDWLQVIVLDILMRGDPAVVVINLPRGHGMTTLLAKAVPTAARCCLMSVRYVGKSRALAQAAEAIHGVGDKHVVYGDLNDAMEGSKIANVLLVDDCDLSGTEVHYLLKRYESSFVIFGGARTGYDDTSRRVMTQRIDAIVFCFPAMFESDHPRVYEGDVRAEHEVLCPALADYDRLHDLYRNMGPSAFCWQMQQRQMNPDKKFPPRSETKGVNQ